MHKVKSEWKTYKGEFKFNYNLNDLIFEMICILNILMEFDKKHIHLNFNH